MVESIFGDGFDLRDYVHRRSLEIQDLRERQLYRQVTDGMMAEMFQYLTEQQAALERRVLSEIRAPGSEFSIYVVLHRAAAMTPVTNSFLQSVRRMWKMGPLPFPTV